MHHYTQLPFYQSAERYALSILQQIIRKDCRPGQGPQVMSGSTTAGICLCLEFVELPWGGENTFKNLVHILEIG